MKDLPSPYWILKMHKPPVGSRFTIASKQSIIQPLSKNITAAFKLLYKSLKKYNKITFYSKVNSFWMIQNNKPVIDTFSKP